MAQRVAPGRVLIIEPDAEEASGNNAGSQDQQHQSSSENDAFSVRHSAAPQKKKQDGATPLLLREAQIQEHMRWDRSDSSDDDIYLLVRHELQELNKQAGVLFIRRHTDRKQGELYGDWIFRRQWTSNKGSILSTIVQYPLVSDVPVLAK